MDERKHNLMATIKKTKIEVEKGVQSTQCLNVAPGKVQTNPEGETEMEVEDEVFARRPSVPRTPPTRVATPTTVLEDELETFILNARIQMTPSKKAESAKEEGTYTTSESEEETSEAEERNKRLAKRKRMETPVKEEKQKFLADCKKDLQTLERLSKAIHMETSEAKKLLQENPSIKKELRKCVENLGQLAENLGRALSFTTGFAERAETAVYSNVTRAEAKDCAIQTEPNAWEKRTIPIVTREEIEAVETYEDFQAIVEKQWNREHLEATTVIDKSPLETGGNADVLLFVHETDATLERNMLVKRFKELYPSLLDTETPIGALTMTACTRNSKGERIVREKNIIKAQYGDQEESVFAAIRSAFELRRKMDRTDEVLVMHTIKPDPERLRRMVECLAGKDSKGKITVCIPPNRTTGIGQAQTKNGKRNDAVIIKTEGGTYADLLKNVKKTLMDDAASADAIKSVRKTKEGNVLLELKKQESAETERVKNLLSQKLEKAEVRISANSADAVVVRVIDLDEITTKKEVQEALENALGGGNDTSQARIEILSIRPVQGGHQYAVVRVSREIGDLLLDMKRVKVGLAPCRIKEDGRKNKGQKKCFRCWETGHTSGSCKGTDRRDCCLKCGEKGHLQNVCKSAFEYCPLCKAKGHKAGTKKCKKTESGQSPKKTEPQAAQTSQGTPGASASQKAKITQRTSPTAVGNQNKGGK